MTMQRARSRTGFWAVSIGFLPLFVAGALPHDDSRAASSPASAPATRQYLGASRCGLCHAKKSIGEQYTVWKKTKHATAFATLATSKAKEIGRKRGIDDPQKSAACLRCHQTAHGAKPEELAPSFRPAEGVGCETCHGPSSEYYREDVHGKGWDEGIQAGLMVPDEQTCVRCHNSESPTFKGWDWDRFSKSIVHSIPKDERK